MNFVCVRVRVVVVVVARAYVRIMGLALGGLVRREGGGAQTASLPFVEESSARVAVCCRAVVFRGARSECPFSNQVIE